jgi:hypothetical protein
MILAKESAETDGVTLKEFCVLKAPDGTEWPSMYARLDGTKMDLETVREVITRASKLVSIVSKVPAGNIDSETELVDVFPFTETHVTDTTNVEWIAPPWQSVELGYISELATSYPLGDARGSSGPTGCVSLDYWFDGLQHLIKLGASGDTSRAALQERYDRWILQPMAHQEDRTLEQMHREIQPEVWKKLAHSARRATFTRMLRFARHTVHERAIATRCGPFEIFRLRVREACSASMLTGTRQRHFPLPYLRAD